MASSGFDHLQQFEQSVNGLYQWFPLIMYGFMGTISYYVMIWHNMDVMSDRFRATYGDLQDTFDFIVVGAGSAGAAVANRLSENYNVLLLEAGGEPNPLHSVPGLSFLMLSHPQLDWLYKTVPQKRACFALPNHSAGWSAGRGLGGTSNANFLIYLRGHPKDFDMWGNVTGDPTWSYEGVLPYFKSIEDYRADFDNDKFHGHSGEMRIETPDFRGMGPQFIRAAGELGYPHVDLNAPFKEGFAAIVNPMKNGRRQGTFQSFIEPIRNRRTLTIYKFSTVHKVLLNAFNEAYGVEYERHGESKVAYANKEVIISAGAIGSPRILMLSGIGRKDHLESLGIKVKSDLPVGLNVQDHISAYLGPFFVDKPISLKMERDVTAKSFVEYTQTGKGPLTTSGTQAAGFISTTQAKLSDEGDWPDIQYILLGNAVYDKMDTDFARAFHVKEDVMKKYFRHAKGKDSFQIITSLARPRGRGEILLSGPSVKSPLKINPRYLENDDDVRVLVEGVKRAIQLVENTTTFRNVGGRFTDFPFPGCENVPFRSDQYFECFIRQYSITLHHIVGSCSMGRRGSKDAVVDPSLRVIGVSRLRVIDASVMPVVPVSNTHAASVMVGAKGADIILKRWANSPLVPQQNNEIS